MYQLFLRNCRDAMDEESVMYTIVEGSGVVIAPSSDDAEKNSKKNKKNKKKKKAGSAAADYTIMNVKE